MKLDTSILGVHTFDLDNIETIIDNLPAIYQAILEKAGTNDRQGFLITMVELSAAINDLKGSIDNIMQQEKS